MASAVAVSSAASFPSGTGVHAIAVDESPRSTASSALPGGAKVDFEDSEVTAEMATTWTQTDGFEGEDDDDVTDEQIIETTDVDGQHLFQTIDSATSSSSAVSGGCYDHEQNFQLESLAGFSYIDHDGIGLMSLTDLEAAAARMQECDDEFVAASAFDFEYESVTLHRTSACHKVGLTLCYGATYDGITDIFIGEIEPSSIAAENGRIREGDQIIQINGIDVRTREQAIQMFAESAADITLLLARPIVSQIDDGFVEVYHTLDDVKSQLDGLESAARQRDSYDLFSRFTGLVVDESGNGPPNDCDMTSDSFSLGLIDKDSGLGRTDDGTNIRDSSIERELEDGGADTKFNCHSSQNKTSLCSGDFAPNSTTCYQSSNGASSRRPTDHQAPLPPPSSSSSIIGCPQGGGTDFQSGQDGQEVSVAAEIAALSREMERIRLQYREIVNAHRLVDDVILLPPTTVSVTTANSSPPIDAGFRSPRSVPRMGTRVDPTSGAVAVTASPARKPDVVSNSTFMPTPPTVPRRMQSVPESTSSPRRRTAASADRCSGSSGGRMSSGSRPSPHSDLERRTGSSGWTREHRSGHHRHQHHHQHLQQYQQQPTQLGTGTGSPCSSPSHRQRAWNSDDGLANPSIGSGNDLSAGEPELASCRLQTVYSQYADVMYTNAANLQHTIALQQNLFQQILAERQRAAGGTAYSNKEPPNNVLFQQTATQTGNPIAAANVPTAARKSSASSEWVVKRRPDGTRYITKRHQRTNAVPRAFATAESSCLGTPVAAAAVTNAGCEPSTYSPVPTQSQPLPQQQHKRRRLLMMLREQRARQLEIQRRLNAGTESGNGFGAGFSGSGGGGATTDDDAASEIKLGRYWTREERRQHVQQRRERMLQNQQRQQEMLAMMAMMTSFRPVQQHSAATSGAPSTDQKEERTAASLTARAKTGNRPKPARSGGAAIGGSSCASPAINQAAAAADFTVVQKMLLASAQRNLLSRDITDQNSEGVSSKLGNQLLSVTTV